MLELLTAGGNKKPEDLKTLILLQGTSGKNEMVAGIPITAGFGTTSIETRDGPFGTVAPVFDLRNGSMILNGASMEGLQSRNGFTIEFFVSDLNTRKSFCSKGRSFFNRIPTWNLSTDTGTTYLTWPGYQSTRWEHIAITGDETGVRVFSNGIMMMSRADALVWGSTGAWNIGYTDAGYGNGYFDQFRVSNVNRYPHSGFRPPTEPFKLD